MTVWTSVQPARLRAHDPKHANVMAVGRRHPSPARSRVAGVGSGRGGGLGAVPVERAEHRRHRLRQGQRHRLYWYTFIHRPRCIYTYHSYKVYKITSTVIMSMSIKPILADVLIAVRAGRDVWSCWCTRSGGTVASVFDRPRKQKHVLLHPHEDFEGVGFFGSRCCVIQRAEGRGA